MPHNILILGGAGFIGSHLADYLIGNGHCVRVLDNLSPQVHEISQEPPSYLHADVEFVLGDVRNPDAVRKALSGIDAVFHFAAAVGVGQSMYQVEHYTSVNNLGTAVLMEALIEQPVQRLVVASSMSIYGEGLYRRPDGSLVQGRNRSIDQLMKSEWELADGTGATLIPCPTPESKQPDLASIYALSKFDQECMCRNLGQAYDLPVVGLRFFNVFGTRQALSNPYTGVLAIFASRFLNGNAPLIFEDGNQKRDFVSVHDVVQACALALDAKDAVGQVFNIGSGRAHSIREVAGKMARALGKQSVPIRVTGQYRKGDIRHCFADISAAQHVLGYEPQVSLDDGLIELAEWLQHQKAVDRVSHAERELKSRGLTVNGSGAMPGRVTHPVPSRLMEKQGVRKTGKVAVNGRRRKVAEEFALITGGAGFIGTNMANRLLCDGHAVRILDDLSRAGVEHNMKWMRQTHGDRLQVQIGDIRNPEVLRQAVAGARQVYHFAGQTAVTSSIDDPLTDFEVNLQGTVNLLEALRSQSEPPPLLFTSTNKVYGALEDVQLEKSDKRYVPVDDTIREHGIADDRPLEFHSPYGCSKGAGDQYVLDYARSYDLPTVVFRMSCIYGPHQFGTEDQGWVAHFLLRAIHEETINLFGDGRQVRDILFVDDLVDAMLGAMEHMGRVRGRAFNVGGGVENSISLLELLDLLEELHGRKPRTRFARWRTGDQQYFVSDTRALSAVTGWKPRVSARDGVRKLHSWLLRQDQLRSERPTSPVRSSTQSIPL